MSDLQIVPEREKSVLPAVLIALLVLAGVAVAIFYLNPRKVADLSVVNTQIFAPHTEFGSLQTGRTNGMKVLGDSATSGEDDLYVVVKISMTDRLRLPLFLTGATAHVVFADGSQVDSSMIPSSDVKRLQTIFPSIEPLVGDPIPDLEQFDPGQTRVGTFVFGFAGQTAQAWQGKRKATLTLELRNQEPQTVPIS